MPERQRVTFRVFDFAKEVLASDHRYCPFRASNTGDRWVTITGIRGWAAKPPLPRFTGDVFHRKNGSESPEIPVFR